MPRWGEGEEPEGTHSEVCPRGLNEDAIGLMNVATLEISAGSQLLFDEGAKLKIGRGSGFPGHLRAIGLPDSEVVFKCADPLKYWNGISFDYCPGDTISRLIHCRVERGGNSDNTGCIRCDNSSPRIERCLIADARKGSRSRGINVVKGAPVIRHCRINNCGQGIFVNNDLSNAVRVDTCAITNCNYGVYNDDKGGSWFRTCNFTGNSLYGVYTTKRGIDATNCWWGATNGPAPSGSGNRVSDSVAFQPHCTTAVAVMQVQDVAAIRPLVPSGTIVSDTAVVITPVGRVLNKCEETVTCPVRMRIGTTYQCDSSVVIPGRQELNVSFPGCTMSDGRRRVVFSAKLPYDERTTNDSLVDSVLVRRPRNVAARRVVEPHDSLLTIDMAVNPAVKVANYTDSAQSFRVMFRVSGVPGAEYANATVPAHDSVTVWFGWHRLPGGSRRLSFRTDLPDDNPTDDTVSRVVFVRTGNYFDPKAIHQPQRFRMAADPGNGPFIAERGDSSCAVFRYDPGQDTWPAVGSPGVVKIDGIAMLGGQAYVVGVPEEGWLTANGLQPTARNQISAPPSPPPSPRWGEGEVPAGTRSEACPRGIDGLASVGQAAWILRYDALGDSWVPVTECDSTLEFGSGSVLVGDGGSRLYLIPGGNRVLAYDVGQDSWSEIGGAPDLAEPGAAGWSRNRLYVLTNDSQLVYYDTTESSWESCPVPDSNPDGRYTGLCCDPVMGRVFTFRRPDSASAAVLWEFEDHPNLTSFWTRRESLAGVADDAGLCFSATQAWCLDGAGGFWHYRPQPVFDAAATTICAPPTVPPNTTFPCSAVVQNSWQEPLAVTVQLLVGGTTQTQTILIPPQSWYTLSFVVAGLPPGVSLVMLSTALVGDSLADNDFITEPVTVPLLHDVAALVIANPAGWSPWDSTILPVGRIANYSGETLAVRVGMTMSCGYEDSAQLLLPPGEPQDMAFTPVRMPYGGHDVRLWVQTADDENPANDTIECPVDVRGDYWRRRTPGPCSLALLGAVGPEVDALARDSATLAHYYPAGDSWRMGVSAPVTTGCIALAECGDLLYALAPVTGGGVINRYRRSSGAWDTSALATPVAVGPGCGIYAPDSGHIYLLAADSIGNWRCFDVSGDSWAVRASLPAQVGVGTAVSPGGADRAYVLTGENGSLYDYDVAGDSWTSRLSLPGAIQAAALDYDPARNCLYALTRTAGPPMNFMRYDCASNCWQGLAACPDLMLQPALAVAQSRVFALGGSAVGLTEYVPDPICDVAALALLALPDAMRFDSLVSPKVVVQNLSPMAVACYVTLKVGSRVDEEKLDLAAGQIDSVVLGPSAYDPGRQAAHLTVTCPGDGNAGNNCIDRSVFVRAPWVPCRAPSFECGRLTGDDSGRVYAASLTSDAVEAYDFNTDLWQTLPASPFATGCAGIAGHGNRVYVLGPSSFREEKSQAPNPNDQSGPESRVPVLNKRAERELVGVDSRCDSGVTPGIYYWEPGAAGWQLLSDSLPASDSLSRGWIVADDSGLLLVSALGWSCYRFDTVAGWRPAGRPPVVDSGPIALAGDQADAVFLTFRSDSSAGFAQYSRAQDTWWTRSAPPVLPEPGIALAATADRVVLLNSGPGVAETYVYDRQQASWSTGAWPDWSNSAGAGLGRAGERIFALTGDVNVPTTWFWQYDPDFIIQGINARRQSAAAGAGERGAYLFFNCRPNPFTGQVELSARLPVASDLDVGVYDATGRLRCRLCQRRVAAGIWQHRWSGRDEQGRNVPPGVYIVKFRAGKTLGTRRLIRVE